MSKQKSVFFRIFKFIVIFVLVRDVRFIRIEWCGVLRCYCDSIRQNRLQALHNLGVKEIVVFVPKKQVLKYEENKTVTYLLRKAQLKYISQYILHKLNLKYIYYINQNVTSQSSQVTQQLRENNEIQRLPFWCIVEILEKLVD